MSKYAVRADYEIEKALGRNSDTPSESPPSGSPLGEEGEPVKPGGTRAQRPGPGGEHGLRTRPLNRQSGERKHRLGQAAVRGALGS